jgi:hypothetical protein
MAMNGRVMAVRIGLLVSALMPTTFVAATAPVSIRVSPAISFAPANLVVQTVIEPDADNREMEIVADGDDFYRSSTVQLDGDRAAKTTRFEFHSVPPGEYRISATVIGADGRSRAIARSHVRVIESGLSR